MSKIVPLQKARENRSAAVKEDNYFHSYEITPSTAKTAVLLLNSPEDEVLCRTLKAITKFQSQDMVNRQQMLDMDTLELTIPHFSKLALNLRRYAFKTVAQLCQLPAGPERLLKFPTTISDVIKAFAKEEDVHILEMSSLILAELCREPEGCDKVLPCAQAMYQRLVNCPDPDVKNNCLKMAGSLLADCVTAGIAAKGISWPPVLELLRSPYPEIQLRVIHIVDLVLSRASDQAVNVFKSSTGLNDLFEVLENYEYHDIHERVLGTLRDWWCSGDAASFSIKAGVLPRLINYLEQASTHNQLACLAAMAQLTVHEIPRKAMFELEMDMLMCQYVKMSVDACVGVRNMTKMIMSAQRMCTNNLLLTLLNIVQDENLPWLSHRLNAQRALAEFCLIIPTAARLVAEARNFDILRQVAIDSIFNHHASSRFAYTGRLEINHFTQDGFYVTQRKQSCFPVLSSLLRDNCSPRGCVYVCYFNLLQQGGDSTVTGVSEEADSRSETTGVATPSTKKKGGNSLSDLIDDSDPVTQRTKRCHFPVKEKQSTGVGTRGLVCDDPYLRGYLERVRCTLMHADPPCFPTRDESVGRVVSVLLWQRAKLLGEFVARQLCGMTELMQCSTKNIDVHLCEIKTALQSSVIPMGYIRVGGPLERSVLYKVLADRIALPCALQRSKHSAWVEVALPVVDEECKEEILPSGLIRANYLVELVKKPGTLLRLGSREANCYVRALQCGQYD